MAIAAEWDYQLTDGIRPFTMPLMILACTALERVPLTRPKITENLMKKFHQDLVFCRSARDCALTLGIRERQVEKIDPLLKWVETEFGCKPVVYSSFFGGKQDDNLVNAIQSLLKKTDNCELAAIDAIAAASQSLIIAIGIFRGKLQIEVAVEVTRLEEDLQIDRWGLVEGGHISILVIYGFKFLLLLFFLDFQGDLKSLYFYFSLVNNLRSSSFPWL